MMRRHRKYALVRRLMLLLTYCATVYHYHKGVLGAAPAPLDYLIPPPLPASAPLPLSQGTRFNQAIPSNNQGSESRTVPLHALRNGQTLTKTPNEPGFMSRVARWFGFNNEDYAQDQQAAAANANSQLYYYPRPQQQGTGNKEPCNLCNKYPWVPMMHNSVHYPWDSVKAQKQVPPLPGYIRAPTAHLPPTGPQLQHAASNVKQRAVQFGYPAPQTPVKSMGGQPQYSSGPFIPMTIPNLSNSAQLPIYNARPFRDSNLLQPPQYTVPAHLQSSRPATALPLPQHQLAATEATLFSDGIDSAHSEIHLDTVIPTQIPPSTQYNDPSFEIIKSHQITDYVASVEYPATFVQTQSFDILSSSSTVPTNNQAESQPVISTGRYQHSTLSPYLNQHVPASQILTEPGSFVADNQKSEPQQLFTWSEIPDQSTVAQESQLGGHDQVYESDNYASASAQNSSVVANGNFDTWPLETNDFLYATTTPEINPSTDVRTTTTTRPEVYSTTESAHNNDIEFIASVQTSNQNNKNNSPQTTKLWPPKARGRETPKRMLDAPIQHISGNLGLPRPFTRDPSKLDLRAVAKNHKTLEEVALQQSSPAHAAESPTPTSTYSSVDASGHFAGMSPPAKPIQANKNHFIPFTTKNQPRPFESTNDNNLSPQPSTTPAYSSWIQAQNADLHTPAETMLVNVKSVLDPEGSSSLKNRNTKYLTKVLASNLRELLQKEHTTASKFKKNSPNSLSIDLHALQKNIDDWTEQEYTSLSHRPSTPTILGRSKHIPKEYLPSTTTSSATVKPQRQSKTTKGFVDVSELPASVNSLEPLYERGGAKRFQYTAISDNHLQDMYESQEVLKYKSTTPQTPIPTTRPTTTTTKTTTTTSKPPYHLDMMDQEPEELWRKAKVSISPKTKEKVYVVTPQPIFFPQRQISSTTTTQRPFLNGFGSGFKSPRFLVRPTPGNVTASNLLKILGTSEGNARHRFETSQEQYGSSFFVPDQIGLRGLSAYVPSEPVEIIDGNSKVLKIVKSPTNLETTTSPQNIMDLTKDKYTASKKKIMVEPSPR
ncbi:mucin-2 isoform X1 [Stomoxys calcitrans]|uniref:mucin-2 isoform X1 n=1 Tax=Stomoxys calcitrans TaxID=35570 RepID=UPI0027E2B2C7|nr:mucin-2 isoform X1 [Stomoxys calcitrans]